MSWKTSTFANTFKACEDTRADITRIIGQRIFIYSPITEAEHDALHDKLDNMSMLERVGWEALKWANENRFRDQTKVIIAGVFGAFPGQLDICKKMNAMIDDSATCLATRMFFSFVASHEGL